VACIVALVSAASIDLAPAGADTVRIHGSTTFNRALMEPFQKDIESISKHRLEVVPNKSANGIIDLLEGRADMAMISAPLAVEVVRVEKLRPELNASRLVSHSIAETRVAFVVHPTNMVKQTTLAVLAKVFNGEIKSWQALGGADLPILTAYVRSAGGVTHVVQDVVLKGRTMSPAKPAAVDSPVQVAKIVAQERMAIGLAQLRLAREYKLKELSIPEPVVQVLNLVTAGKPKPVADAIIKAARSVAEREHARSN
jgi:phosphate transport system substrate-binding protein